ncbi:heparinase II/III family protein [Vreelandella sp. F11]|uniref:heparinase II/III domain-containing protein n=1 Tax=Vreelandella sp. F11 TaxID=3394751 RepID=UPI0036DC419A
MSTNSTSVLWSGNDFLRIRSHLNTPSLLGLTLKNLQANIDAALLVGIVIPGQGEAGSFEHNTHKDNAKLIESAALLGKVTDNQAYLDLARDLLLGYASIYSGMPFQVARNTNPPGKLFHQILNEHIWLLSASLGYSLLQDFLCEEDKKAIVDGLFEPMLEMFTVTYAHDFDRIHNHGLWAVAAIGICGMALDRKAYVEMAVYGLEGSGEVGGFLAQIEQLFSPDGYYVEGPYYHRFAIHPLCLFAEALERHYPSLVIFDRSEKKIGRSIKTLLATAYPNGAFPALNDASRTMGIDDEGVRCAMAIYFGRYGYDEELAVLAQQQKGAWAHAHGAELSDVVVKAPESCWAPSVLLTDGVTGQGGGHAHLKQGEGAGRQHLVVSAGQHGMGHGHFDQLGLSYFSGGREFLQEYGFCRWINVEPKFGGRYLPENEGYAKQSVAHNLVVVDCLSQHQGDHALADRYTGRIEHFVERYDVDGVDAVCCSTDNAYPGVQKRRHSILLSTKHSSLPVLIDLVEVEANDTHTYDYVFNFSGQVIKWDGDYTPSEELHALGNAHGYQHLWVVGKQSEAPNHAMTWLHNSRFVTWHQTSQQHTSAFQILVGANDPQHNLRHDKKVITRTSSTANIFMNVFEEHGYFDEASETCLGSTPTLKSINLECASDTHYIIDMNFDNGLETLVICMTEDCSPTSIEVHGRRITTAGYITRVS